MLLTKSLFETRLIVWNRIFMNLEPNSLIYENTNYIGLKLDLNRYNFRVGFWILGKNRPERSAYSRQSLFLFSQLYYNVIF